MNLIKSLMGRRQFLVAAGVTSASALAYNKLAGVVNPIIQPGSVMAAEKAAAVAVAGASSKYTHLFSPIKVGNNILKSRMLFTAATPHFMQGPENFPAVPVRDFYIDLARNGVAVVTMRIITNRVRAEQRGDSAHMVIYDLDDAGVQNYLDLWVESLNMVGTKAAFDLQFGPQRSMQQMMPQMTGGAQGAQGQQGALGGQAGQMPGMGQGQQGQMPSMGQGQQGGQMPSGSQGQQQGGQGGMTSGMPGGTGTGGGMQAETEYTEEELQKYIDAMLTSANFYRNHGFGVALTRGGTGKSTIAAMKALKKAWPDVILWSRISATGTVEAAVEQAKKLEGQIDIVTVQEDTSKSHCLSYNSEKDNPGTLKFVEAIKKAGVKIIVAPNGGYQDMDKNEEYIATGKTDMIAMGRAFIADTDYAKKAYDGRGDDVTPCLLCNKCHGVSFSGSWFTVCAVNPKVGISQAVDKIQPPTRSKKVAVIGGGAAGMKAAITAAERGHKVTLYEKNAYLGGQLRHADFSPFKWTFKDFKDYLVRQLNKNGIAVLMNTAATPEMIKGKGYDAVIVAVGSEIVNARVPGSDGKNVYNLMDVYGKEKELGRNVVVIGGSELGVDTGMYLAKAGHKTTILTSDNQLMDRGGPHQGEIIMEIYQKLEGFSYILGATVTKIADGKVYYKDSSGSEKSLAADSVVAYGGRKPRQDEALKYSGLATQFYIVGDCTGECGNVQKVIRNAFFQASLI
jgi:2,4-dienoyl-CoA reductase-like NADH-dependent reductase (Old Yellow Enzyme family)/thioredoxin reductase